MDEGLRNGANAFDNIVSSDDIQLVNNVDLQGIIQSIGNVELPSHIEKLEEQRKELMTTFDEEMGMLRNELRRIDNQLKKLLQQKKEKNNELLQYISEEMRKCNSRGLNRSNIKKTKIIKRIKK